MWLTSVSHLLGGGDSVVRPVTHLLQHQGPHPAAFWGAPRPSGEDIGAGGSQNRVLYPERAPKHSSSLQRGTHHSLRLRLRVLLKARAAPDGADDPTQPQHQPKVLSSCKNPLQLRTKKGMEGLSVQAGSFKPQPTCLYTWTCIKKM